jgi:hypothetical protein
MGKEVHDSHYNAQETDSVIQWAAYRLGLAIEQVDGKAVTKGMAAYLFGNIRFLHRWFEAFCYPVSLT